MGIPQRDSVKMEGQPLVVSNGEAVGDSQVVGLHAQQPCHQSLIGTVALAGLCEGAMEPNLGPHRLRPQQCPGHAADTDRSRRVGAGGSTITGPRISKISSIRAKPPDPNIRNPFQRIIPAENLQEVFPGKLTFLSASPILKDKKGA